MRAWLFVRVHVTTPSHSQLIKILRGGALEHALRQRRDLIVIEISARAQAGSEPYAEVCEYLCTTGVLAASRELAALHRRSPHTHHAAYVLEHMRMP